MLAFFYYNKVIVYKTISLVTLNLGKGDCLDIGKRIKALRTKSGLTLEELASRCELTKGFLSQLENNLTSPSISTLEDITEVLGVSLETFFKEEKEEQIRFNSDDYFVDEKDKSTITWLVPNAQKNEMEPNVLDWEPGLALYKGESSEIEPHEGEEFAYVLEGKVDLIDLNSKKKITLKKGETFYLKGNFSHKIVNNSKQVAEIIWITTPPLF